MKTIRFIAYDSNNSIMDIREFVESKRTAGFRREIKASMKRCSYYGVHPLARIAVEVIHSQGGK